MKNRIRPAAVAGMFYPADPIELKQTVNTLLNKAKSTEVFPKAIIAPHAGYIYSGPVAACAYKQLLSQNCPVKRVVLVGPAHRVPFSGLALPAVDAFASPLGTVPLDKPVIEQLGRLPFVHINDIPHRLEHSLEVHLPFLQEVLGDFTLVPIVVGQASPDMVVTVLEPFLPDDSSLIVISSDLSHYHDYKTASKIDLLTTQAIEERRPDAITHEQACGATGIRAMLKLAQKHRLRPSTIDLKNSGDTTGDKSRVVGYGAYAFYPEPLS